MAWKQMAPLNRLYTWDLTTRLIEQTVPRLAFDPYFTSRRLEDLRRLYGWSDRFNEGKSILFAQSGVINGNPFLFGEYLDQDWGTETYDGVLDIEWEEWEEDSDGDGHYVTRSETLHAQVEKPIPVYSRHKLLIYGNDAAPNLKFSREPSGFSSEGGGLIERWRKWRRLRKLEAFSRNLEDSSNFTLMGNHEFETWFHTPNRNNEVEFRLLFTPVAQLQMLALLQDHKVGYGDDFTFRKDHRINMLTSTHLDEAVLDTSPERFHDSTMIVRVRRSSPSTNSISKTSTSRLLRCWRFRSISRRARTRTSGRACSPPSDPPSGNRSPWPTTMETNSSGILTASRRTS